MKKILNNPIAVAILAFLALFYMYWNVARPIMGWDKPSKKAKTPQEKTQKNTSKKKSSPSNPNKEPQNTIDSNAVNQLSQDWVFMYSRDPFRNHLRGEIARRVDLRPQPKPQISKSRRYSNRKYRKSHKNNYGEVQALSIGPENSIALINGKAIEITKFEGDLKDTVQIQIDDKLKTFTFQPKANP